MSLGLFKLGPLLRHRETFEERIVHKQQLATVSSDGLKILKQLGGLKGDEAMVDLQLHLKFSERYFRTETDTQKGLFGEQSVIKVSRGAQFT